MKIALIGKFNKMHDEEYIARSFEDLGHIVKRIPERCLSHQIIGMVDGFNPDIVLFTKFFVVEPDKCLQHFKEKGYRTVSWNFDLYWGYERESRIRKTPGFKADIVFTTDGGHEDKWKEIGITHYCVRQGIYKPECIMIDGNRYGENSPSVVFVGSHNTLYPYRQQTMDFLKKEYGHKFKWYGKDNTNELRGTDLNEIYADSMIVVGDSVYSPRYWSNRVVETLGRGGFLIHQEVEGLKEEYPYLVTYKKGDLNDLKDKIEYYLRNHTEREELRKKNFEWVLSNYTMEKQCQKLLNYIS